MGRMVYKILKKYEKNFFIPLIEKVLNVFSVEINC